jgi:hypothetical protein
MTDEATTCWQDDCHNQVNGYVVWWDGKTREYCEKHVLKAGDELPDLTEDIKLGVTLDEVSADG